MASLSIPLFQKVSSGISAKLRTFGETARILVPVHLDVNLMYQTSFACLFFMALFSLKSVADFVSERLVVHTAILDFIALRVFDVLLLQILSIFAAALAVLFALRRQGANWTNKKYALIFPLIVIGGMIVSEFILESLVLKPTFSFNRPGETIGEPWLTDFLRNYYDSDYKKGSSTPSGFIVRQTMLSLLFIFSVHQPHFFKYRRTFKLLLCYFLVIFVLAFMAWLRLYTGAHRFYDVAIAIGIGGFLFWAGVFIFLSFSEQIRSHIGDFALPALTFAFMVLLYSQHFLRWMLLCGGVIVALTTIFHPISSAPSCKPKA